MKAAYFGPIMLKQVGSVAPVSPGQFHLCNSGLDHDDWDNGRYAKPRS